jgi:hypothetical protein
MGLSLPSSVPEKTGWWCLRRISGPKREEMREKDENYINRLYKLHPYQILLKY